MNVALVILAGGEGRRIGGGKPLQIFGGQRLIDRALRFAGCWSDTIAVAVRDPVQVGPVDVPVITDVPDIAGPLAGLAAGLAFAQRSNCNQLLTIPADMPFLPHDLPSRLAQAITGHRVAVATSGGQLHPVCALWSCDVLPDINAYRGQGRRSLRGLAGHVGSVEVEGSVDPFDPFFNVNFAEDLCEAERRLEQL